MAMFEHVYVITCTSNARRYSWLRIELQRAGIREATVMWDFPTPMKKVVMDNISHSENLDLHPGTVGCWGMHYRAIKTAHELGQDNVLFVEDDCRFRRNIADVYRGLEQAPGDWGVLMLDNFNPKPFSAYSRPENGWLRLRAAWSTACYMVRRKALTRLAALYDDAFSPNSKVPAQNTDHYLCPAHLGGDIPIYGAVPNLAIQQDCDTTSEWGVKHPYYVKAGIDTSLFSSYDCSVDASICIAEQSTR